MSDWYSQALKARQPKQPRKNAAWKVINFEVVREGTYRFEVDTGIEGVLTARLYPDGSVMTSREVYGDKDRKKLHLLIEQKLAQMVGPVPLIAPIR